MAVVGTSYGPHLAELKRRLAAPALVGRVAHHPRLTPAEMVGLLRESSVFLLPTWIDTGPTTLKEALAMGLWPVCYDNSGPGHYLRKFGFGTLARDRDRADLVASLRQALQDQPWRAVAQREKIESLIRPHFRRDRIWGDLQALYQRVIAAAPRA